MSGFLGVVCAGNEPTDRALLERLGASLHRPGAAKLRIVTLPCAAFCFSGVAPSPSQTPAHLPIKTDDRFWLVGEIRLDGRAALLDECVALGLSFSANISSEELLLHLLERQGEALLPRLLGDFSFALWDNHSRSLLCVRDFFGLRGFFYAQVGSSLYFSNDLNALRGVPGLDCRYDDKFLYDFLVEGWCRDPERTAFAHIRRLAPGHLLRWQEGRFETRRFLQLPLEDPLQYTRPEQFVEEYLHLLEQAVADRLPSAPAAIFLSGGLDSGSVAAIAAKIAARRGPPAELRAFTVSWASLFPDPEPQFASETARHLGLPHDILSDQSARPLDPGPSGQFTPEPIGEYFFARSLRYRAHIAQYSGVVLGGEGGDDILTAQAWPHLAYLWKKGAFGEAARLVGAHLRTHRRLPYLGLGLRGRFTGWLQDQNEAAPPWIQPEMEKRFGETVPEATRQGSTSALGSAHPLHPSAYEALHQAYWAGVFELEDPAWTGISLQSRAPLLDLRLIRFLLRVPPLPWCAEKELARQSLRHFLPDSVRLRRKTPLAEDPLAALVERGDWAPPTAERPPELLNKFVLWENWIATFSNGKSSALWKSLRPLLLARWLKAVENRPGIK